MKINLRNIVLRLLSPALRLLALFVLVQKQDGMASEALLLMSYIYLCQVLVGLELYTKANVSFSEHVSNYFLLFGIASFSAFLFLSEVTFAFAVFFFTDSIINEIIRKSVIFGKLVYSNFVLLAKSTAFLLSAFFAQTLAELWVYLCLQSILIMVASCFVAKLRFKTNFPILINLLKQISINAIAISLFLRTVDIGLRERIMRDYGALADELSVLFTMGLLSVSVTLHGVMGGEIKDIFSKLVHPNPRYFIFMGFLNMIVAGLGALYFSFWESSLGLNFLPGITFVFLGTVAFCIISILGTYYIGLSNALALKMDLTAFCLITLSILSLLQNHFDVASMFCFFIYGFSILMLWFRIQRALHTNRELD